MGDGAPIVLRDNDIRWSLHQWLLDAHACCGNTGIIHELKIPRPSSRIDLAVVNGRLAGFEIKSDVDSLSRLPRQVLAFSHIFDELYVVTTERHVKAVRAVIPDWWGIAVPIQKGTNISFRKLKRSKINRHQNTEALLHMLCRRELIAVLASVGIADGKRSTSKPELVKHILTGTRIRKIKAAVRNVLRQRRTAHSCG